MKCTYMAPRAWDWLCSGRPARILHLFDEVCNLVNDRQDVLSLTAADGRMAPFSMLVDKPFTYLIDPSKPIVFDPQTRSLIMGAHSIDVSAAQIWNPRPDWPNLAWKPLLSHPLLEIASPEVLAPMRILLDGLEQGDELGIISGTRALAGLGPGLTPAGDDVLIGIIFGLWVWFPSVKWIECIAQTAIPRTTALSAAFLQAARAGEASHYWHALVVHGIDAVDQLLAVGATSGRDAWQGFVELGRRFATI